MKGSTLNRFLEEVGDAAVQVVPLGKTGLQPSFAGVCPSLAESPVHAAVCSRNLT